MMCLICRQAVIVDGLTSVKFRHGESSIVVNKVPARNCPSCGEAYLNEDVVARLLRNAEEMARAGILQDEIEYESLQTGF